MLIIMKLIVERMPKVDLKEKKKKAFFFCIHFILVVKPILISCPDNQLFLTVKLNNINPNDILLGENNCKPNWSNETHVQFMTNIDNCSLVLHRKENFFSLFFSFLFK